MTSVLRISEAASIGMHTMGVLADHPEELFSTGRIAELLDVSEAHLSKVLQRLTHAGLVRSVRGPRGGFALARDSGAVTLLDVYEAIDGPLHRSGCLLGRAACVGRGCILGGLVASVNEEVGRYLRETRLSELKGAFAGVK